VKASRRGFSSFRRRNTNLDSDCCTSAMSPAFLLYS
jgi:hypothetical protein